VRYSGRRPGLTQVASRGRLAALTVFLALMPNNPGAGWYAVPEFVCGWFHSDRDQWQCDTDAVEFTRRQLR
jgi:hypothetical protein